MYVNIMYIIVTPACTFFSPIAFGLLAVPVYNDMFEILRESLYLGRNIFATIKSAFFS